MQTYTTQEIASVLGISPSFIKKLKSGQSDEVFYPGKDYVNTTRGTVWYPNGFDKLKKKAYELVPLDVLRAQASAPSELKFIHEKPTPVSTMTFGSTPIRHTVEDGSPKEWVLLDLIQAFEYKDPNSTIAKVPAHHRRPCAITSPNFGTDYVILLDDAGLTPFVFSVRRQTKALLAVKKWIQRSPAQNNVEISVKEDAQESQESLSQQEDLGISWFSSEQAALIMKMSLEEFEEWFNMTSRLMATDPAMGLDLIKDVDWKGVRPEWMISNVGLDKLVEADNKRMRQETSILEVAQDKETPISDKDATPEDDWSNIKDWYAGKHVLTESLEDIEDAKPQNARPLLIDAQYLVFDKSRNTELNQPIDCKQAIAVLDLASAIFDRLVSLGVDARLVEMGKMNAIEKAAPELSCFTAEAKKLLSLHLLRTEVSVSPSVLGKKLGDEINPKN